MGRKVWIWLWTAAVGALLAQRRESIRLLLIPRQAPGRLSSGTAVYGSPTVRILDAGDGWLVRKVAPADAEAFTVTGQTHTAMVRVPLR